MRPGVFAKTFAGDDPLTVLSACGQAGFHTVQYNMACSGLDAVPDNIDAATANSVGDAARSTGVGIAAISATYNMTDPIADRRAAGRAGFAAIAGRAAAMQSPMLTVCSGSLDPQDKWRRHPANDDPSSWTAMCREFEIICAIAADHRVLIGVEPEPANIVSSARRAAELLATFPNSPIRIVLDPANIIEDVPPDRHLHAIDEALDLLGPMIALAHAKDRFPDGSVAPAGQGVVDWPHFLKGLAAVGYDGPLIAHGMSADAAPGVAAFLAAQIGETGS